MTPPSPRELAEKIAAVLTISAAHTFKIKSEINPIITTFLTAHDAERDKEKERLDKLMPDQLLDVHTICDERDRLREELQQARGLLEMCEAVSKQCYPYLVKYAQARSDMSPFAEYALKDLKSLSKTELGDFNRIYETARRIPFEGGAAWNHEIGLEAVILEAIRRDRAKAKVLFEGKTLSEVCEIVNANIKLRDKLAKRDTVLPLPPTPSTND